MSTSPPSESGAAQNLRLWHNKGQAIVGNGNTQYDVDVNNGGTLNLIPPHPGPVLVPPPMRVLPRTAEWPPLGRAFLAGQVENHVKAGRQVEVLGEDGIGK